jgi:hypothetical protein
MIKTNSDEKRNDTKKGVLNDEVKDVTDTTTNYKL